MPAHARPILSITVHYRQRPPGTGFPTRGTDCPLPSITAKDRIKGVRAEMSFPRWKSVRRGRRMRQRALARKSGACARRAGQMSFQVVHARIMERGVGQMLSKPFFFLQLGIIWQRHLGTPERQAHSAVATTSEGCGPANPARTHNKHRRVRAATARCRAVPTPARGPRYPPSGPSSNHETLRSIIHFLQG